jgi:hypothetical protein
MATRCRLQMDGVLIVARHLYHVALAIATPLQRNPFSAAG